MSGIWGKELLFVVCVCDCCSYLEVVVVACDLFLLVTCCCCYAVHTGLLILKKGRLIDDN